MTHMSIEAASWQEFLLENRHEAYRPLAPKNLANNNIDTESLLKHASPYPARGQNCAIPKHL